MKKMDRENYVMRRKASIILLLCGDCWLAPLPTTQAQIPHQHQPAPVNTLLLATFWKTRRVESRSAFSTSPVCHSSARQPRCIISAPRTAGA